MFFLEKKCRNTHRHVLVSDVVWEYCEIFVFSHHASVFRIVNNPIAPALFAQSVMLSVLCLNSPVRAVLLSNRWCQYELISSPCFDWPLSITECLQATPSVSSSSSWDRPVYSAATFPATVWSQFKLDFKERATTNKIKHELEPTAAVDLLCNKRHATANVSLQAH